MCNHFPPLIAIALLNNQDCKEFPFLLPNSPSTTSSRKNSPKTMVYRGISPVWGCKKMVQRNSNLAKNGIKTIVRRISESTRLEFHPFNFCHYDLVIWWGFSKFITSRMGYGPNSNLSDLSLTAYIHVHITCIYIYRYWINYNHSLISKNALVTWYIQFYIHTKYRKSMNTQNICWLLTTLMQFHTPLRTTRVPGMRTRLWVPGTVLRWRKRKFKHWNPHVASPCKFLNPKWL